MFYLGQRFTTKNIIIFFSAKSLSTVKLSKWRWMETAKESAEPW